MNIQVIKRGSLSYAQIDFMYDEQEVSQISKELMFLETIKSAPESTLSATDNGKLLKHGDGIFVDDVYAERKHSTILRLNRKLFLDCVAKEMYKKDCTYLHLIRANHDTTLINFYGNNGSYESHTDSSALTAVTFFNIGSFSGGNFCFPDFDVSIKPIPGRTVIFPGCIPHRADPTFAEPGNYRVTMAQFVNYK